MSNVAIGQLEWTIEKFEEENTKLRTRVASLEAIAVKDRIYLLRAFRIVEWASGEGHIRGGEDADELLNDLAQHLNVEDGNECVRILMHLAIGLPLIPNAETIEAAALRDEVDQKETA